MRPFLLVMLVLATSAHAQPQEGAIGIGPAGVWAAHIDIRRESGFGTKVVEPAGDLVIGGFPSSDTCMRAGRDMGREMMRFASRRNGRAYGLLICVDLETGDVVSEDMP